MSTYPREFSRSRGDFSRSPRPEIEVLSTLERIEGWNYELRVQAVEIDGRRFLDVRRYFRDAGVWMPSSKGVVLGPDQVPMVIDALRSGQAYLRRKP